ncbi:hypothetical protein EG329_006010 [Mollisiaceae sp. DMI_Dod_QoI]|nr:hypothetical protein EG329_006010 [Helotiales sp. DMI_Dod_QoI]
MAASVAQSIPVQFKNIVLEAPVNPHAGILPAIDVSSSTSKEAYKDLAEAASTVGCALITNLAAKPPIASIQRLFTTLYCTPDLATRLNATYPTRGVFKTACLNPDSNPSIDQKTTIDLSVARLQKLREIDPALVADLGQDFTDVLDFYQVVEKDILPLLLAATSRITRQDLSVLHSQQNNNLRLIDYFPASNPTGPRCGEHRDYGTYTVTFQDGSVGGLEFEIDGHWVPVPINVDAVVSWGWCGAILSDDKAKAAKHRVLRTNPVQKRRTTANVFVAPDLDAVLKPVGEGSAEGKWSKMILNGGLKVGQFKEILSKTWRRREGNEEGEVVEGGQDNEVLEFVKGV